MFFVLAIASCGGDTERTPQREIYILAGQSNMTESPAGQVGLHDALRTRLSELRPKAEIVLVPTAVGGTHILQWQKGAPLYMSMLSKTRTELQAGGFVAGMFFWQGEQDAGLADAPAWPEHFQAFVASVREEFDALPIVFAQIGPNPGGCECFASWELLQAGQAAISITDVSMVITSDLTPLRINDAHFVSASYDTVGKRMAAAMSALLR